MRTVYGYLLVFIGAGLGGALRHSANVASVRLVGPDLPLSTLLVNVLGSLSVGCIAGYFAVRGHGSQATQLFLTTGILGGFTTFSAFSLEAALLWERGQLVSCALFVLGSVILSIAAVFAGLSLIRSWHAV
jgi:CrcB protein